MTENRAPNTIVSPNDLIVLDQAQNVTVNWLITSDARAGDWLQAFALLLPADTAVGIPLLTMLLTALSRVVEAPPPMDIEAIELEPPLAMT